MTPLSDCRFYCSGSDLNFSVFSDVVCRVRYLDSIEMTLVEGRVDVYAVDPAVASRWIVIRNTEGDGVIYRWFLRDGENFFERKEEELTPQLRAEVFRMFPYLAPPRALAA